MTRRNLTRSRLSGVGVAAVALAIAACGHSNSTPTPVPTATASSIVPITPTSAPCVISLGIAYEPDGGNGNGFNGIQETHYEGNDERTCAAVGPTASPLGVRFADSVGTLAISATGSDGIVDTVAVLRNAAGGYSLVQDVFGASSGNLVPAGTPYDVSVAPPTVAPTSSAASTSTAGPVIPDVTSVETISGGSNGLALVVGPAASPPAIVAITSLVNAPPQYGLSVTYNEPTYAKPDASPFPRSIVRLAPSTLASGSPALVRGQDDLLSFNVTNAAVTGYQFNLMAQDTTLGSGALLRGAGNIAFDPSDVTRALLGGTTAGAQSTLTLVTGLPGKITPASTLAMPGTINSLTVANNGVYAVVGTSVGLVVVSGVDTGTLAVVKAFAPNPAATNANAVSYTDCTGATSLLSDIYSVKFGQLYGGSTSVEFLVALGTSPGLACPSGNNASLVAFAFDPTTGSTPAPTATPTVSPTTAATAGASPSPTPSPTPPRVFVQNNVIAPPAGADLLVVR